MLQGLPEMDFFVAASTSLSHNTNEFPAQLVEPVLSQMHCIIKE